MKNEPKSESPLIGERKYTLSEAMELIQKERMTLGANEFHAKNIREAEERGYQRALKEVKRKIDKMIL